MWLWRPGASFADPIAYEQYEGGLQANLKTDDGTLYKFSWAHSHVPETDYGRLDSITRPDNRKITFLGYCEDTDVVRDDYGRALKIYRERDEIDGIGSVQRIFKAEDPTGRTVQYFYEDGHNNLTRVVGYNGLTTWFEYGSLEVDGETVRYPEHYLTRMIQDTNENGKKDAGDRIVVYAYDGQGRLDRVESPAGEAKLVYEDVYEGDGEDKDLSGGKQQVRDELTHAVTTVEHDVEGKVTRQTDPLNQITSYEYYTEEDQTEDSSHIAGTLKKQTDPSGVETEYAYESPDPQNRSQSFAELYGTYFNNYVLQKDNPPALYGYLHNSVIQPSEVRVNDVVQSTATYSLAEGDKSDLNYKLGKPLWTKDAQNIETTYIYDSQGRLKKASRAGIESGTTEYYSSDDKDLGGEYPLTGRVKTTEDASGNVTRYEYNIEPEGAWGYPHWVEKRITTRNDGTANEIETYSIVDALGRTLESQSERGVTTKTYRVEAERRETTETWFGGEKLSYSTTLSNADGSQKESRVWYANAGGERITKYTYDRAGRLVRTDYPDRSYSATRYYPTPEGEATPQIGRASCRERV